MEKRTPQRISLSLSQEAYSTITSDMDIFQNGSNFDGYINRIIMNYKDSSNASISIAKERERDKYVKWLKEFSKSNHISKEDSDCLDRLIIGFTNDLAKKMNSFRNGVPIKPRIKNDNYDDLAMGSSDFQEELYYPREGKYIKALLEDYSLLPFYEREGVFFKDYIDLINEAISGGNVIKLYYVNRKQQQKQITVRPYKIAPSTLLHYHYLIALPINAKNSEDILTLRISRIVKKPTILSRTSHITIQEQNHIDEVIRNKGIQYIVSQDTEIKVALTEQGYKLYKSILYLRPKYTKEPEKKDGWILTFMCAEEQAKNYFFQFGKEAEILSPSILRDWFLQKYSDAAEVYNK